jgi:hypothetical protein
MPPVWVAPRAAPLLGTAIRSSTFVNFNIRHPPEAVSSREASCKHVV